MINSRAVWAVVPASGIGNRMQAGIPKQYLRFQGASILEHTLNRLFSCPLLDGIVLVINQHDDYWHKLAYQSPGEMLLATGGAERIHSVLHGLDALAERLNDDALILVHDAVRPLVPVEDLHNVVQAASADTNGALLAVPVADTIKRNNGAGWVAETVARDDLWRALTPQVFEYSRLKAALNQAVQHHQLVSDDCAAMELSGYQPRLVAGKGSNIKITVPEDLLLAEQIWLHQRDQDDDK